MSIPVQSVPDAVLASEFPTLADRPAGTYNAKAAAWANSENAMATRSREIAVVTHNNALAAQEAAETLADPAVQDVVENIDAITAVNANKANIDAVADNATNINAVAANGTNINAVAAIDANVTAVAGNATNINAVNANKANIDAVADNATNINAVHANKANIDAVAAIDADVTTVATNSANVTAVAGNATNINAVNANKANIDAVAGNATNINAVHANKANIDTVAANNADVTTVAGASGNVTIVATNIASVNSAATNMAAIIAAPWAASDAEDYKDSAQAAAAAAQAAAGLPAIAGKAGAGLVVKQDESGVEWRFDKLVIVNVTTAHTVTANDLGKIINCTSGSFTVALASAAALGAGFNCWIWNTSSTSTDVIAIDPYGGQNIDERATIELRRGEGVQVVSSGYSWYTVGKKAMRGYAENIGIPTANLAKATGSGSVAISVGEASGTGSLVAAGDASSSFSTSIGRNSSGSRATTVTGSGAMALGGSYVSGTDSFAAAVANNTSSYGATGNNSVVFGYNSKATANHCFVLGDRNSASVNYASVFGGYANTASASGASVLGSYSSTASGHYSVVLGGSANLASGQYSQASGFQAVASQYGKQAFASGRFAVNGDAQAGRMVLRRQTTGAGTTHPLSSDIGPGVSNQLFVPPNGAQAFRLLLTVKDTSSNDAAAFDIKGLATRDATTMSFVGTPIIDIIAKSPGLDSISINISLYPSLGLVQFYVIGIEGKTLNWVGELTTSEVIA